MNPAANDYSAPNAAQNISLAEADQFRDRLAGALAVEFGNRFVKTTTGAVVSESDLRQNASPAQPVNLWGTLADAAPAEVNIAELRACVRAAALGDNPVGDLENALKQALPKSDVQSILLRVPAIQSAVRSAIAPI
jgi:hypothetical protein